MVLWIIALIASIILIILSVVWFIVRAVNPEALAGFTWLYGWGVLILGIIGTVYSGIWKTAFGHAYAQSKKIYNEQKAAATQGLPSTNVGY